MYSENKIYSCSHLSHRKHFFFLILLNDHYYLKCFRCCPSPSPPPPCFFFLFVHCHHRLRCRNVLRKHLLVLLFCCNVSLFQVRSMRTTGKSTSQSVLCTAPMKKKKLKYIYIQHFTYTFTAIALFSQASHFRIQLFIIYHQINSACKTHLYKIYCNIIYPFNVWLPKGQFSPIYVKILESPICNYFFRIYINWGFIISKYSIL